MHSLTTSARNSHRRTSLILTLVAAIALCNATAARASDWINGDTTMYREAPHRSVTPPPTTSRSNSGPDDGAVSVTDPGAPGTAPDQRSPQALQGNVNQFNSAYAASFYAGDARQAPLSSGPQARIVAPKVYQGWLQQTHPSLGTHLKTEVVNIKGQWDDSTHALHNFGIVANKISPSRLTPENLVGTKVLVVDCAGELSTEALSVVGAFVRNGGYLLTTDWALDGCVSRACPGFINWNGGYSPKELVDAHVMSPDLPFVEGTVPRAYWNLDMKCQTVHILKSDAVTVLARSRELMRDDPDQQGILAVTFRYGKGRVLHLVGHFDSNSDRAFNNMLPDPAPRIEISLRQAIAANFIAEALEASSH